MVSKKDLKIYLKISIVCLFLLFLLVGCMEKKSMDDGEKSVQGSRIIYVDDSNMGPWFEGTLEDPFSSIQDAFDEADEGDTIFVFNGVYECGLHNEIFITKTVDLFGESRDETVIVDNSQNNSPLVYLNAPNITFENFSLCSFFDTVPPIGQTGIIVGGDNVSIRNCFFNTSKIGIHFRVIASNCMVSDCVFRDSDDEGIALFGDLNMIKDCIFYDTGVGIESGYGCSNNTITYCEFYDCSHSGMTFISGSNNNIVSNCSVISCISDGIQMSNSYQNRIYDSEISNNIWNGVSMKNCSKNQVYRCDISNNDCEAVWIYEDSSDNIIYHNNIIRNQGLKQVYDEGINQWDNGEEGNYWSDYTDRYPNANSVDGVWDIPYTIAKGDNMDRYPLVNRVNI